MAGRRSAFDRLILTLLIVGAVVFVLLLSGVAASLLTTAKLYHPSP
jgi:hypothetical protein